MTSYRRPLLTVVVEMSSMCDLGRTGEVGGREGLWDGGDGEGGVVANGSVDIPILEYLLFFVY